MFIKLKLSCYSDVLKLVDPQPITTASITFFMIYRAFHNVLRDYKQL
jgi:hypothetical protein